MLALIKKFYASSMDEEDSDLSFEDISSDEDVELQFLQQYVREVKRFSSQYGSDISISYTACNIIGKPTKFPNYGDFPQTFVLRTYGTWWLEAPSRQIEFMPQNSEEVIADDFIDLQFEYLVHPFQIYIYETYNPGSVIRIWCAKENGAWSLLWETKPQKVPPNSRAFCPAIRPTNFPTNLIRLEFNQRMLEYHTELDAVMLVGTISSQGDYKQCSLVNKIESLGLTASLNPKSITNSEIISFFSNSNNVTESNKDRPCGSFSILPNETISKIFEYLDLLSLTRCALVNKRFYEVATDALLYLSVSLKPYWHRIDGNTLRYFINRCRLIQKLDLSWCGDHGKISAYDFISFILQNGATLTHLRLNCCEFVNSLCLKEISKCCINLKELGLRNCAVDSETGFASLANLHELETLDLYRAWIEGPTLVSILRSNPKLKHLSVGACGHISAMDDVAFALSQYNTDLISVDFWKSYSLGPAGVHALANCKKIQELDIGWCLGIGIPGDCLRNIARNCTDIRKIILAAVRGLTDSDLIPLFESCLKLEQIDLLGLQGITNVSIEIALQNCKLLKLLDISFCDQISDEAINIWREDYSYVSIKRSYQADMRNELQPVV